MSRLLRLYPAAWRERYEAEFIGTLQERPVGLPAPLTSCLARSTRTCIRS